MTTVIKHGTSIEWTQRPGTRGQTWNPIIAIRKETGKRGWHCEHVNDDCRFCYSERSNVRGGDSGGTGLQYKPGVRAELDISLHAPTLERPLHWREPRTIFVCSMSDLFGDFVTDEMLDRIFTVMALCQDHTFIVLTKRPARMRDYITKAAESFQGANPAFENLWGKIAVELSNSPCASGVIEGLKWPLPNVWVGTSCGDQKTADGMIPDMLATPAAIHFVSCEPLRGTIHLGYLGWPSGDPRPRDGYNALLGIRYENGGLAERIPKLDWVIAGGESGFAPGIRPMHPEWARFLREQCAAANIPFFFKQSGEYAPLGIGEKPPIDRHIASFQDSQRVVRLGTGKTGRLLDGEQHNAFPEVNPREVLS